MIKPAWFTLLSLLFWTFPLFAEVQVPALRTRVTDLAEVFPPTQRENLEQKLKNFEAEKGSQIAVLTVATTQPETIEAYSIRVADEWKLGRKGVADGVLVLLAKNDRKVRIEVGRGLEGAIPDAVAKRIIAEIMIPQFKQGDFAGGIVAGVDRIIGLIRGEPLPKPVTPTTKNTLDLPILGAMILALALGNLFGIIIRVFAGRLPGGLTAVTVTGGLIWFLGLSPLIIFLAVGLAYLSYNFISNLSQMHIDLGAPTSGRRGRWMNFSDSGSSFGGGGSDFGGFGGGNGGGFSGGGGDFGGGGASGSW